MKTRDYRILLDIGSDLPYLVQRFKIKPLCTRLFKAQKEPFAVRLKNKHASALFIKLFNARQDSFIIPYPHKHAAPVKAKHAVIVLCGQRVIFYIDLFRYFLKHLIT